VVCERQITARLSLSRVNVLWAGLSCEEPVTQHFIKRPSGHGVPDHSTATPERFLCTAFASRACDVRAPLVVRVDRQ